MESLFGFGLFEPGKLKDLWGASKDKVIARGVTLALMPLVEELIKDRLANFGLIKRWK